MPDAEPSVTQGGRQKKRDLGLACELAPRDGFEPPAKRLTVACSTAELPGISALSSVIQNKN